MFVHFKGAFARSSRSCDDHEALNLFVARCCCQRALPVYFFSFVRPVRVRVRAVAVAAAAEARDELVH